MFGRFFKTYRQKKPAVEPHKAYELWARSYDDPDNILFAVEETALLPMLDSLDFSRKAFADIGCGTGRHLQKVVARRPSVTVGVDFSRQMLVRAKCRFENDSVFLVESAASHIPFASSTFDIALCTLVLGHVADLDFAVAELVRIMKPGGVVLVSDWHPANHDYEARRTFRHVGRDGNSSSYEVKSFPHSIDDYRDSFRRHGMSIEDFQELFIDERQAPTYKKLGKMNLYKLSRQHPLLFLCRLLKGA